MKRRRAWFSVQHCDMVILENGVMDGDPEIKLTRMRNVGVRSEWLLETAGTRTYCLSIDNLCLWVRAAASLIEDDENAIAEG